MTGLLCWSGCRTVTAVSGAELSVTLHRLKVSSAAPQLAHTELSSDIYGGAARRGAVQRSAAHSDQARGMRLIQ